MSLLGLVILFTAGAASVSAGGGCVTCAPARAVTLPTAVVPAPEKSAGSLLFGWVELVALVATL
jgi:hypothetical protein